MKKVIRLCLLIAFSFASWSIALNSNQKTDLNGQAYVYRVRKTLRGVKYTHTTPVRSRGTWYNFDKDIGAFKLVVKKHQVTWYYKAHKKGHWKKDNSLKGKKLYVYRQTFDHKKYFGFYAAYQDDSAFFNTGTKKINGKKVKIMMMGNYIYYRSWKNAIR